MQSKVPAVLSDSEIESSLNELDQWSYDQDKKLLFKEFKFKGFLKTMSFVNAVAWEANRLMHHPDMEVGFSRALIQFTTHDAGGVTSNDFNAAKAIDALMS
ncbi:4a-hydroxytetrahydrobiopterin dehydratase [Halobacteriovorax sp. GB3]|uniref:4a-hydroxytetrahydrobiopterin dehydratase n=1 Tax=Halobacteriovorax sp. GB3 TaxID=2719615 RepID=UPI00235F389E|nr:4a-hydroxytetrahydrobiopterin dehydratase [Halobacteriovorax sp. GB3]MDD0853577.1 4a-hydroxytetrahydrobiopterin dehydratase [Halobacteriovorax sp. GB3]